MKMVRTDHGLWPDSASTDNFSCSTHDYVTDANFHPICNLMMAELIVACTCHLVSMT